MSVITNMQSLVSILCLAVVSSSAVTAEWTDPATEQHIRDRSIS